MLIIFLALLTLHLQIASAEFDFNVLAGSRRSSPQLGAGVDFDRIYTPLIFSDDGTVVFGGMVEGTGVNNDNNLGLWAIQDGDIHPLAQEGSSLPGAAPGTVMNSIIAMGSNNGGPRNQSTSEIVFSLRMSGSFNSGIWGGSPTGFEPIAVSDSPVGDALPGTNYFSPSGHSASFNRNGKVTFLSTISGDGINSSNNTAVFQGDSSSMRVVAREGDIALPDGSVFAVLERPSQNDVGDVAFRARTTPPAGSNQTGIYISRGGQPAELVVGSTMEAPGTPENTFFDRLDGAGFPIPLSGISSPNLNDRGDFAFGARLRGANVDDDNLTGIWAVIDDEIRYVARSGDQAPQLAPGVVFDRVVSEIGQAPQPEFNNDGVVAIASRVRGDGVTAENDTGIWMGVPGQLELIARKGDAAPGFENGEPFSGFGQPTLTDYGNLVVRGYIEDGNNTSGIDTTGIWAHVDDQFELVIREGQTVDIDPSEDGFEPFEVIDFSFTSGWGRNELVNGNEEVTFFVEGFNASGEYEHLLLTTSLLSVPEPSVSLAFGAWVLLVCWGAKRDAAD